MPSLQQVGPANGYGIRKGRELKDFRVKQISKHYIVRRNGGSSGTRKKQADITGTEWQDNHAKLKKLMKDKKWDIVV
jgi:hypothetical protein